MKKIHKNSKILTKDFLKREYSINKKSCNQIAKKVDCSEFTIRYYLKKYKIKIRTVSESKKGTLNHNYIDGRSLKQYYCIDCGAEVYWETACYGKGKCKSCAYKGNKYRYIDGRCSKKYYCIKCETEIDVDTYLYGSKLCKPCSSRIANKAKWQNPEFREKTLKASLKGRKNSPNKPEKLLIKLFSKILPKTYNFVGNGKLLIGSFCPDFVNKEKNKIIELFGNYWHTIKGAKERDKRRLNTYAKYGYKTLIIWEHELKDLKKVKSKIKEFNND